MIFREFRKNFMISNDFCGAYILFYNFVKTCDFEKIHDYSRIFGLNFTITHEFLKKFLDFLRFLINWLQVLFGASSIIWGFDPVISLFLKI